MTQQPTSTSRGVRGEVVAALHLAYLRRARQQVQGSSLEHCEALADAVLPYMREGHDHPLRPTVAAGYGAGWPLVKGKCPACGRASLFLGAGGHITCAAASCPSPTYLGELLAANTLHDIRATDAAKLGPAPEQVPGQLEVPC